MKRKPLPDLLKGLAVILMVQVHIMELMMLPEVFDGFFGRVSLFLGGVPAAPVFMAVMGYFAARSAKGPGEHAWRGLRLIILGFALNIGLNAHLLISVVLGRLDVNPWPYVFGADILFLAGLSLLFIALVTRLAGRSLVVPAMLTFTIPALAGFTAHFGTTGGIWDYVLAFIISQAEWSYFPFFPWAGWVLAGFSFSLLEQRYGGSGGLRKYALYMIILAGVPAIIFLPWAAAISADLHAYYHHGIAFFLWGLAFMLLWVLTGRFFQGLLGRTRLSAFIRWIGKNVTLAYIVQWLIIGNLATAIYRSQPAFMFPILVAGVLLATTGILLLVERSRNKDQGRRSVWGQ